MHQSTEFKVCFAQLYRVAKATVCSGKLIRRRVYASAVWGVGGWNLIQFHPLSRLLFDFTAICRSCQYADPHLLDPQLTLFQCWAQILTESSLADRKLCHVQLATRYNCYHLLAKTSRSFLACCRGAVCTNQCWSGINSWTYQSGIGCLLRISHQCYWVLLGTSIPAWSWYWVQDWLMAGVKVRYTPQLSSY